METFYLILVILLFVLAISDLIVGVSNDAVNFLNSAVGAKAASFKVIMIVATLGVLFGATFSSGMMEVARKGIFHPEYFYFSELILLFLAVMITDVILLDLFNTYGMPTSTTVSIVFELLGAAVALAMIKVISSPEALSIGMYINSGKALAIISGILLSVVIAFTVGAIVQYFTRLLFSFDYEKRMKKFGGLWGGFAVAAISYFILIKGAKGASFMTDDMKSYILENSGLLMLGVFVAFAIIFQILTMFTKVNVMRFIVLIGTFALAMAFAGNDLVNFIGVPLAGYESFKLWVANGGSATNPILMGGLSGKVMTPTLYLLLAGVIMAVTLWLSSKARSVIKTSLDLGRQDEGYERFTPNPISRVIVRAFSNSAGLIDRITPVGVKHFIHEQFDQEPFIRAQKQYAESPPAFDMVRASVTLIVASILIAIGTILKLPLSTTYVTFMVAMGASLADGAWGRESAVYRVSGVVSVVGGWFFTAFSAFSAAFILACLFSVGGFFAVVAMLAVAIFMIYRTHSIHGERTADQAATMEGASGFLTKKGAIELGTKHVEETLTSLSQMLDETLDGIEREDFKALKKIKKRHSKLNKKLRGLKSNYNGLIERMEDDELEYGYYYIIVIDYLIDMSFCFRKVVRPSYEHIGNSHSSLRATQLTELREIAASLNAHFTGTIRVFKERDKVGSEALLSHLEPFLELVRKSRKNQIKRIKSKEVSSRNSNLFFNILGECRDLGLFANSLIRTCQNLMSYFIEDDKPADPSGSADENLDLMV